MSHKKQENKKIKEKFRLEQEMKNNPDWCYCFEELQLEPDIDEDSPVGKTEPVDGFPYWNSKGFTQSIYICKRCGKKYCIKLAY